MPRKTMKSVVVVVTGKVPTVMLPEMIRNRFRLMGEMLMAEETVRVMVMEPEGPEPMEPYIPGEDNV